MGNQAGSVVPWQLQFEDPKLHSDGGLNGPQQNTFSDRSRGELCDYEKQFEHHQQPTCQAPPQSPFPGRSEAAHFFGCDEAPDECDVGFMVAADSCIARKLCKDLHFTCYAIWKVPLIYHHVLEAGRQALSFAGTEVHEDAEHWAFVAEAQTSDPNEPELLLIAQYGAAKNQSGGTLQIGLCYSRQDCRSAMKRFVQSTFEVSTGHIEDMHEPKTLESLIEAASAWHSKPYSLTTNNCQHFVVSMISCCSGHFVQRGAIEGGAAEGEVTEGHFTEGLVSQGDASEGVASEYSSERSAAVTESIEDEVVERGGVKEGVVVVGSTEDIFVADGTITAENGADTRRLRNGIASEVQALKQRITERSKKLARRIASRQPPAKPGANDSHRRVPEDDLSESQLAEEEPLQRLWQQDRLPERCFDPSLSSAAFSGTVETVEVFHSRGADMGSALCHVAQEGHLVPVKISREAQAHFNSCDDGASSFILHLDTPHDHKPGVQDWATL